MNLTFLKQTKPAVHHTVFGKLPSHLDFLRSNATLPMIQELDHHIQEAIDQISGFPDWHHHYDHSSPLDLCLHASDHKQVFLGSLHPSRDGSGRRFPLIAGSILPAHVLEGELSVLPLGGELFFQGLREELIEAIEGTSRGVPCQSFLSEYEATWQAWNTNSALARNILRKFSEENHPEVLGPALADRGLNLHQALLNLMFYWDFLKRFKSPSSLQIMEIPLKISPGETILHASLWLEVLSGLFGPKDRSYLDVLIQHGPKQARLLLSPREERSRALVLAFGGPQESPFCLDLKTEQPAWKAHRLYAETAYALRRLLDNPKANIAELRHFVKDLCKKQL